MKTTRILAGLLAAAGLSSAAHAQFVNNPAPGCQAGVACQAASLTVNGTTAAVTGQISVPNGSNTAPSVSVNGGNTGIYYAGSNAVGFANGGNAGGSWGQAGPAAANFISSGFPNTEMGFNNSQVYRFGLTDTTVAVSQTITFQSVSAGTSNGAGAPTLFSVSRGTGSGLGGNWTLNCAPHGAAATVQNTYVACLSVNGDTGLTTLPLITSDAGLTDASVCEDTTLHGLHAGSGTLGVCLGTSSARYKHDIQPLGVGLAEIMALQPVSYKLNADHGDPNKTYYGFTAEQAGKVLPALMTKDAAGQPNTFDYLGLTPAIVKALQDQQAEIAELKDEVRELKAESHPIGLVGVANADALARMR